MVCLSCGCRIEGGPDLCPRCGAVLDWPDRPVPRPPEEVRMCCCRVVAAVLAVVLLIVTAVWLWLKCGEKGIDPERIKNERVEK